MDVVLGVAVTGPRARLALVGAGAAGSDLIDESFVDLADNPLRKLTDTVVGTDRLLAEENHRLLATRLCWSNPQEAERLRRALEDSGVHNVAVLSESQAATALFGTGRSALSAQPDDDPTVALARGAAMAAGLAGDATGMAPTVGFTGDATAMAPAVSGLTGDATGMAPTVGFTGDATAMAPAVSGLTGDATAMAPAVSGFTGDATAMAPAVSGLTGDATAMAPAVSGLTGDATAMAPTVGGMPSAGQVGPELAYSMAGDSDLLPMEWLTGPEDDAEAKTGPVGPVSRRMAATDVVLGIAVAGSVARLALIAPAGGGYAAIKHLVVELPVHPFETLIQKVAETQRSLAAEGRHLVATRLYSPDHAQAEALRRAFADAGMHDVGLVSGADAVTALLQTVLRGPALPGAVALVVTAEAATLVALGGAGAAASVLASAAVKGVDAATAAVDMLLDWLRSAPFAASAAYVMGTMADLGNVADQLRARSPLRVEVLGHPDFAIARGAAMAAGLAPTAPQPPFTPVGHTAMAPATQVAGGATGIAPTAGIADANADEPQLAYSQADDAEPFGETDEYGDEYPVDDDEAADGSAPLSRRSVLIGNAVVAFAVIGLASLAAAVAIAVRPTSSQQPVVGHQNAAPGKFMPLLPTQQQAPVPPPPPDAPYAGFQGGVIPDANGYIPPQLTSPGGGGGAPGLVPNPNGPIPAPVIVPYPGWRPPYPGWRPPYPGWPGPSPTTTPPTTTTTPPTTTTTPPTTTTTPPTTTTTPPTTTTTPPTTTTTPPTTTTTPPTTTTTPPTTTPPTTTPPTTTPPTTQAPKVTTPPPTTAAPKPTTAAPKPPPPTQTVAPKPPTQQAPQQTVAPKPPPVTTPHH